ncbi:unnamed protein product [Adineta ricciae]|uniref:Uncharacterized protein n=1 Tax=Adineta ricciae TaxID=249248 RepID=A0A813ZKW1_ADIRI|nr:unnamed protein product [Adineta ricciae]CAF1512121.1 unnamed protein product [Adineta ricciae]
MRPPRIVNRGRIGPSSPKPIIDSGRNSFSSASVVSTIDDIDPEPESNAPQQVAQKLEQSIAAASIKKKIFIIVAVCVTALVLFGISFGVAYSLTMNKSSTTATTTTTITATTTPVTVTNTTHIKI